MFTYYEGDNYIDFFEVTTYDTKTLKVRHVEGPMWDRFEQYLNERKYGVAKIEGIMPYKADIIRFTIRAVAPAIAAAWVISRRRKNRLAEKRQGCDTMKNKKQILKIALWVLFLLITYCAFPIYNFTKSFGIPIMGINLFLNVACYY